MKLIGTAPSISPIIDPTGKVSIVNGSELIGQSIGVILNTTQGTDEDNPLFGSRLYLARNQPDDQITEDLLYTYIQEALQQEPRIRLDDIRFDRSVPGQVECNISYTIISNNSAQNLIYPFYTQI